MKHWLICALLFLPGILGAQTVAASGKGVQDGSGNILGSGTWCFGGTCLTVAAGSFSGTITPGTQTVTVKNASAVTILTVPNVTAMASQPFNWNQFVVPVNITVTGVGQPYLPCYAGSVYSGTSPTQTLYCQSYSGQTQWGSVQSPVPAGVSAGYGAPTFACQSPCQYNRLDTQSLYAVNASWGLTSNTWYPLIGGTGCPIAGCNFLGPVLSYSQDAVASAYAYQSTPTSNNGIAMSLSQCLSLPYACQVLAPALYAQTEVPGWAYWSYTQNSAITQSAAFLDQRFGGNYWTSANPYTFFPSTSNANIYSGFSLHTIYAKNPGGTPIYANYYGTQIDIYHTQGGNEQMTFGGGQSQINALALNATRNTAEAGATQLINAGVWAPGDFEATSIHISGPGGFVNQADEGVMYHSDTNDESPSVPEGTISSVSGSTVTATSPLSGGASTQGEYRFLIRTGSGTTVVPTNIVNQVGSPILGSTFGYFSALTFSSVSADSAWGTITQNVTSPGSHTVTFTTSSGTAAANTLTCIASEDAIGLGYYDEVYPSSVSGGITAVFSHLQPSGAIWFQGGHCGLKAELVADTVPVGTTWNFGEGAPVTTYPVRYLWADLGSIDGTNDLFATITNTGNVTGAVGFGSRWGLGSPPATENVILYPGLQVINVAGANGDTTDNKFTFNVPAATEGFAASQTFEEAQTAVQAHGAGFQASSQYGPFGYQIGLERDYYGRFSGWGDTQFNHVPVSSYNYTPVGSSTPSGGTDQPPGWAYGCTGVWNSCLFYNPFPGTAVTNSIIGWVAVGSAEMPLLRSNVQGAWLGDVLSYNYNGGTNRTFKWWFQEYSTALPRFVFNKFGIQMDQTNTNIFPQYSVVPYAASSTKYLGMRYGDNSLEVDSYNPASGDNTIPFFLDAAPNDPNTPTNTFAVLDQTANALVLRSAGRYCFSNSTTSAGYSGNVTTSACLGEVGGKLADASGNPVITVPAADTPYNNPTFACPGGQHVTGLNIVNGVIVAAPTCS